ncbi:unnamed protein product [Nesidiocoris tenuis]|uniref:BHLH domain-containing protein n=1 Tax=Nesidiocoris tenuis TaxID=355587 RepID=A0A6H5H8Z3_9HEMI|nr:unnamed protein product [Nesidiocoris tenuis]
MTVMAQKVDFKLTNWVSVPQKTVGPTGKEAIHSGHFMVSSFEAEAQDDEDEVAVPVEEDNENKTLSVVAPSAVVPAPNPYEFLVQPSNTVVKFPWNRLTIETSLTKLFKCMSLAYRQKLTSPKWNRFKGIRLRWKDKIRLNNVIWRCWHMQFIKKKNTLVCQFASPLDADTHNKPEAVVLEGKYWKRKLNAVTAEYKKWRLFSHNQLLGRPCKDSLDLLAEFDSQDWAATYADDNAMLVDEDYMGLMSDTLFSTISANQGQFAFPDTREIARGVYLADFIQPSLVQLQPNLDEIMDIEPLHGGQAPPPAATTPPAPQQRLQPQQYAQQPLQPPTVAAAVRSSRGRKDDLMSSTSKQQQAVPSTSCPESPVGQESLSLSPLNVGSPTSLGSGKPAYRVNTIINLCLRCVLPATKNQLFFPIFQEHRRVCHINAEQKRRCNIKNGFDTLHSLIPMLNQNPNIKMSKAAMLQKGAEYIMQLQNEKQQLKLEMDALKQRIETLNSEICNCQSMLPATGAPISKLRSNKVRDMYRKYVRVRVHENWKFWILSVICEPLLESFNNVVSTASMDELYRTTLQWVDQHCSLVDLRPIVLNALRHLCTTTDILSDPARLPIEARNVVDKAVKKS